MKHLKRVGLVAAMAAMALLFAASGASATTLEIGGVTKNESVTITASLKPGTSLATADTFGFAIGTCLRAHMHGSTSTYTGATVKGPLTMGSGGFSLSECDTTRTTHTAGSLHISHIAGTTNGTVTSSGAEVTTGSPFGELNCKTGEGTHLGTLTGQASGHAEMVINAHLSCSGISTVAKARYVVTTPTGLGVSA